MEGKRNASMPGNNMMNLFSLACNKITCKNKNKCLAILRGERYEREKQNSPLAGP